MSHFENWDQDNWNDRLWTRVTAVNADRSNQYFDRPHASSAQGCQFRSTRLGSLLLDTCNLPNYSTENGLRSMYLINNRDIIDYQLKNRCGNRDVDLCQKPVKYDWSKYPLNLRQRTQEMYKTLDTRSIWIPEQKMK